MNNKSISTGNTIIDNSRSEGNEEKSLPPKEMSVKYSTLNLPMNISYYFKQ